MRDRPSPAWMEAFREAVNADPEMGVVGGWFDADFKLCFGEAEFLVSARRGRIVELVADPRFDRAAAFSLRAPMDVWRKFVRPDPPPLHHDFFAMLMRVDAFRLDGDTLAAMQNARALHRLMTILGDMEPFDAAA